MLKYLIDVATTFTTISGNNDISSLDFSPLLNTELIEQELNDTYLCLFNLANEIQEREDNDDDINLFKEATDFFEFDDLTLSIQISFTACTVTCGTAALGFAVSSKDITLARPYYTISMGVDSSDVVGASIGSKMGFYKNFSAIIGSEHSVSFGVGIDLPLLPDIDLPDLDVALSAEEGSEGEFIGFGLGSDIIDFNFGLDGAFSLGYSFSNTKWVYTTKDLADLWNAVETIVDDKVETVNAVIDAYNTLTTDILGNGGFLVKTAQDEIASLYCPSGISDNNDDNTNIGNLSILQLGAIEVYDVVFGNIEGDYNCNSSTGYETVKNICQYGSKCSFTANADTLGNVYCDTSDIDLTVIYGCPDQLDVFNLGCYSINFLTVIDNTWYQDYNDDILDDGWEDRNNGMAKCAKIANDKGYKGFASYNNGMCLVAKDLFDDGVYNEYGAINGTTKCPSNGLGNDVAMNLYAFANGNIAYDDLGCINKTQIDIYNTEKNKDLESSFITFENEHYLFQDEYKERKNAISKCAQIAEEKGYKGFALFDGGKCFVSNKFNDEIVGDIRDLTNVNNDSIVSCGKGTDYAYNAFQFPYIDFDDRSQDNRLTNGQIAMIVIFPLIFIALLIAGYFLFKKYKFNKGKKKNKQNKKKKGSKKKSTSNVEQDNSYILMK